MSWTVHTSKEHRRAREGEDGVYFAVYLLKRSFIARLFFGPRVARRAMRMGDSGGFVLVLIGTGEDAGRCRVIPCTEDTVGAKKMSPKSKARHPGMQVSFRMYGTPFPAAPIRHVDVEYIVLEGGGIEFGVPPWTSGREAALDTGGK